MNTQQANWYEYSIVQDAFFYQPCKAQQNRHPAASYRQRLSTYTHHIIATILHESNTIIKSTQNYQRISEAREREAHIRLPPNDNLARMKEAGGGHINSWMLQ